MSVASMSSDNGGVRGTWANDFVCSHKVNSEHTRSSSELWMLKTAGLGSKSFFHKKKRGHSKHVRDKLDDIFLVKLVYFFILFLPIVHWFCLYIFSNVKPWNESMTYLTGSEKENVITLWLKLCNHMIYKIVAVTCGDLKIKKIIIKPLWK